MLVVLVLFSDILIVLVNMSFLGFMVGVGRVGMFLFDGDLVGFLLEGIKVVLLFNRILFIIRLL